MVKIWQQQLTIPTYDVGDMDKNPMFLEKRVYQGSSGKVYPYPVIDKIFDEKHNKDYTVIFIENEFVQVQIMPEIGGRIYRAIDLTNGYDFVYHNHVIKPALVGLTGPWISGGIEFNWPQHHRPNTFGAVEYRIDDSKESVKTVWLSERDRMYGTKVTTGISLRDGVSAIEITSELFNPTGEAQTFLWWANPAVAVHDETQSVFPPDVHAVMDHGKRDVSNFPIATGTYYKMDYSKGVDISWYKNIPVPTSYMAYHSDYEFVGGYDYRAKAGILHVADHHVAPGKKQWTWGNGEFGKAWDRNLTDEDGPYIELMTGVFTDNQPDFTWLQPYQNKNFTQYFLPYKELGYVKCANKDIVMAMDVENGVANVRIYATRKLDNAKILLKGTKIYLEDTSTLSPNNIYIASVKIQDAEYDLILTVESSDAYLTYTPEKDGMTELPNAAKAIGAPETLPNNEALWLAGLHLEQYRHATYEPDPYYLEGLKRDPHDLRINNAYGNLLLRRGQFLEAKEHFLVAKKTATRHSPNPYDGEVFFNLGKAFEWLGEKKAALDAYYKATWSDAWKTQGYLKLAQISARKGETKQAIDFGYSSLYSGYKNFATRASLTILLRKHGDFDAALRLAKETLTFDAMDFVALRERDIIVDDADLQQSAQQILRADVHNAITLAQNYAVIGEYEQAVQILDEMQTATKTAYPMMLYYRASWLGVLGQDATSGWQDASNADSAYCFPNSLSDYKVLKQALDTNPKDGMAAYYLGCFLYDKKRPCDAFDMWKLAAELNPKFATVHRNLALCYANKMGDYANARVCLETAFSLDRTDARVFYELCELYRKIALPLQEQLAIMEENIALVKSRDDLCVAYADALSCLGKTQKALELLRDRNFHPWEGGEGKVPSLHRNARIAIAKELMKNGQNEQAIEHLENAFIYYENFGEGKLYGAQENDIWYYLGIALQSIDKARSKQALLKASEGLSEPTGAMYYNDQPPYTIYFQGLALRELGEEDEAKSRFNKLIAYGEKHIFEKQVMDYFAVSLPDFLVFETDLDVKNEIHCNYMMALGHLGLGHVARAKEHLARVFELEPHHYGALTVTAELHAH